MCCVGARLFGLWSLLVLVEGLTIFFFSKERLTILGKKQTKNRVYYGKLMLTMKYKIVVVGIFFFFTFKIKSLFKLFQLYEPE